MKQNKPDGREAYITPSIEVIKWRMKESLQQAANLTIHYALLFGQHLYPLLQFGIQQRLGRPNQ